MSLLRDLQQLPRLTRLNLVLLGLMMVALTLLLWPHWRKNPDLSHGFFMPFLFLLLLHESRSQGAPRYLAGGVLKSAATVVLLLAALLSLGASGLYAAAAGWSHPLVPFGLTTAACLLLGAGLLTLCDRKVGALPCNWTSLVAIGLWLLCAPIPPGTYSRLTLNLQLAVSQHVLGALHLLGIAASRHGNIIELAHTSVGVEEACSGVRSLISCVFAGFFFSATLVSRTWARGIIILLAAPIALVMNFLRSLTLTLLANHGVDITGTWHDVTGFSVLGLTAVILGGLAMLLEQRRPDHLPAPAVVPAGRPAGFAQISLSLGLGGAVLLSGFFYVKTRPATKDDRPAPDLTEVLPATAPGWQVSTSGDLYQFSGILQTENLIQRSYFKMLGGQRVQLTVYLAYWNAGQSSVSEVAMHTPDACWPGSGWVVAPVAAPRVRLALPDRMLPAAEARKFQSGPHPQFVWFWHLYDGRPIIHESPRVPMELLRVAWRYGFTRNGNQLFVRVSSNQPWPVLRDEPLVRDLFQRLHPLGL